MHWNVPSVLGLRFPWLRSWGVLVVGSAFWVACATEGRSQGSNGIGGSGGASVPFTNSVTRSLGGSGPALSGSSAASGSGGYATNSLGGSGPALSGSSAAGGSGGYATYTSVQATTPPPDEGRGGAPPANTMSNGAANWMVQWDGSIPATFNHSGDAPNAANSGAGDPQAVDGKALNLVLGKGAEPTPNGGAEVGTLAKHQYGTFSTRLRTADCSSAPGAGVVTGFFTYFNDGTDSNANGIADNSEIDFEWLCAEPETIYLTVWTDYRDTDEAQRRVGRAINLSTGEIRYSCYYESFGDCMESLAGEEAMPASVTSVSGYNSSKDYYEYGFDWASDRVVFWMKPNSNAAKVILWDYRGPQARITQRAAALLTNVWHTNNWAPPGNEVAIASPSQAVTVSVDWTRYQAP